MSAIRNLSVAVGIMLLALAAPALAQSGRTLKIVNPFPAGGTADIWARILGEQIGRDRGMSVVIENRPGGGTVIATDAVSHAPPDGNTVLVVGNSFTINPNIRKLNYDPVTSFEPICYLLNSPQVIAVHAESPYRTLAELISAAKAKPGELTLGVNGPATAQHLTGELFKRVAGIDMTYVPFTGGAPAVNALLGQHVTSVVANYSEVVEQMKAGKLRALAATGKTRIVPLPDLPTIAESGYKDFDMSVWFGLVAPAKTPPEALAQLGEWFTAAMQVPEIKQKLAVLTLYPVGTCGAGFAAHIRKQLEENARIVREANNKGE
jgi:tripartite-type tricarboxylate transporter receptor subunit TctC